MHALTVHKFQNSYHSIDLFFSTIFSAFYCVIFIVSTELVTFWKSWQNPVIKSSRLSYAVDSVKILSSYKARQMSWDFRFWYQTPVNAYSWVRLFLVLGLPENFARWEKPCERWAAMLRSSNLEKFPTSTSFKKKPKNFTFLFTSFSYCIFF